MSRIDAQAYIIGLSINGDLKLEKGKKRRRVAPFEVGFFYAVL